MPYLCLPHFYKYKDAILKIESITKSCMLDSQESSMEIHHLYMDKRNQTSWKIYILCHMQRILKRGIDI